jgi:hypothetical protein
LHGARDDQRAKALRGAADRRGRGEPEQSDDERPLAPEVVADPAAEQQQAAERERIRGHDPLAVVVGEVQRLLRGGQRDVHHGGVEHHHQLRDAEHREDQAAPVVVWRAESWRRLRGKSGCRAARSAVVPLERRRPSPAAQSR